MAKQNPADRFSLDNQMIVRLRDLKSAQSDRQLACLELAQKDSPDRRHAVDVLEAEIRDHELAIDRLNAAKLAQASQDVETDNTTKLARLAELNAQRDAAVARAKQLPVALVDYLAAVGPQWVEGLNALSECNALTREILRVSGSRDALKKFGGSADTTGHSVFGVAVGSALASTGLGSLGPNLSPYASITPTTQPFTASDLERGLDNLFNRQAEAIDRACNPVPATATLED